jgi:hypothetical protein
MTKAKQFKIVVCITSRKTVLVSWQILYLEFLCCIKLKDYYSIFGVKWNFLMRGEPIKFKLDHETLCPETPDVGTLHIDSCLGTNISLLPVDFVLSPLSYVTN